MFRLWVKEIKHNHLIRDMVVCNDNPDMNRTKKVFSALDEACHAFDLQIPAWLDININDFKKFSKARFTQDSFVEHIDFDYLEIHVIEEDWRCRQTQKKIIS